MVATLCCKTDKMQASSPKSPQNSYNRQSLASETVGGLQIRGNDDRSQARALLCRNGIEINVEL